MLGLRAHDADRLNNTAAEYQAYFGLGHAVQLTDSPDVFRVSPAGLSLGDLLVRRLDEYDLTGSFLELGTGSGALALLLKSLGAIDVTATDISASAVKLAEHNELQNFGNSTIQYLAGDLFSVLDDDARFDHVIFNPPGWRSPSELLAQRMDSGDGLASSAMFGGERVVLDFLENLPERLTPAGRAIIGLNSMIGIQSVLTQYKRLGEPRLRFRLIERHTFPLMLYTESWQWLRPELLAEFARWRDQYGSVFCLDADGTIYWSYEIIECDPIVGVELNR